jgi:hypothetical protein
MESFKTCWNWCIENICQSSKMSCTPSPGKHHPIRAPFRDLFSWPAASRSWWAGTHCLWPSTIIFFLSKRNKRNRVDIERIVGRLTSVPAICRKALPYNPGYLECLKEERYMWLHWLQGFSGWWSSTSLPKQYVMIETSPSVNLSIRTSSLSATLLWMER